MRFKEIILDPKNLLMYISSALLLIITIIGIIGAVYFYQTISGNEYNKNSIVVSGTGVVNATPDVATINVTFQEESGEVKEAEQVVNKNVESFVDEIRKIGIDKKNIKTQNYSVRPKYEQVVIKAKGDFKYPPTKREQVGFIISQQINIKIYNDHEKVSKVMDAANNNKPHTVWGPNYHIDDDIDYTEEALEKAIKQAKEKARNRARVLGVSLGDLISYSEGGGYYNEFTAKAVPMLARDSAEESVESVLPAGEQEVRSTVTLEFEIK